MAAGNVAQIPAWRRANPVSRDVASVQMEMTMAAMPAPFAEGDRVLGSHQPQPFRNLIFASACAYLSALSFGLAIGYSSPAIPDMIAAGILDKYEATWFGSLLNIGAILGGPIAGPMLGRFGRKWTLMASSLPFLLGWMLLYSGYAVHGLYIGRTLTGIGIGMVMVVSPTFLAEIAPKNLRGMLGSGVQLGVTVGILAVYVVGSFVTFRNLALFSMIWPIACIVMSFYIPESPRFLLSRKRRHEALVALTWLRGPHADVDDECTEIAESLDEDDSVSLRELFKKSELSQPLKVAVGLMCFQQFSGINVVMFYSATIFEDAGFGASSHLASIALAGIQVLGTLGACYIIDRSGRRILLFGAGIGMALACFAFACYYAAKGGQTQNSHLYLLALFSMLGFMLAFSLGWGPIPMLVMSEIFPVHARGNASAITAVAAWSSSFIVTKGYYFLEYYINQSGAFVFFGICCVASVLFVWKRVPETKEKSLEEIELYFVGRAVRGI